MNHKYIGIALFFLIITSYFYFDKGNLVEQSSQANNISTKIKTDVSEKQIEEELVANQISQAPSNKTSESSILTESIKHVNKDYVDSENIDSINEEKIDISQITNTINSMIDNSGVMDKPSIESALKADDFSLYIEQLEQNANVEEIEKQAEIRNIIASFSEINRYQHDVACGHQVCAISVRDFPEDSLAKLSNDELLNLPLGTSFLKKIANKYGNYDLRVIYQIEQVSKVTINME